MKEIRSMFEEVKEDRDSPFSCFETIDEAVDHINDTVKVILITSGTYATTIVPKLVSNKNIISFNILCKPHEVIKV